jgi:hypothetical protein
MVTTAFQGEFVRQENVRAFLFRLETERDPVARALLRRLLAEHTLAPDPKISLSRMRPWGANPTNSAGATMPRRVVAARLELDQSPLRSTTVKSPATAGAKRDQRYRRSADGL